MNAVVAAFNQEKALVGAFSVITNLRMDLFEALASTDNLIMLRLELLPVLVTHPSASLGHARTFLDTLSHQARHSCLLVLY